VRQDKLHNAFFFRFLFLGPFAQQNKKLDIDGIWVIDHYGGADNMKVADYLSWTAAADAVVV